VPGGRPTVWQRLPIGAAGVAIVGLQAWHARSSPTLSDRSQGRGG
jgi:hypothetical protein